MGIARRAQGHYFVLGLMDVCIGGAATLILPTLISRVLFSAVFLVVAILFFMSSWRFNQIRKVLADSDTKSDSR